MKRIVLVFLFLGNIAFAQGIAGSWEGELNVMGSKLPLVFHIAVSADSLKTTMDSPKQGARGIPIKETHFEAGKLTLNAPQLMIKYEGMLEGDSLIRGTFHQSGLNLNLELRPSVPEEKEIKRPQTPQPPYPYYQEEVVVINKKEGNRLAGTIFAPNAGKKMPIMVMITGSGAQNRDEELFNHKPFLVIADFLARNGIATLRMDDRGVDGSEAGKPGATSLDFAGDISSAVDFLRKKGYKNIGLIGHSEGGMIAPMVSAQNKKVKFMVLLAGPGISIPELLRLQTYQTLVSTGTPEGVAKAMSTQNMKWYAFVKNYRGENLAEDLISYIKKENPILPESQRTVLVDQLVDPWFEYFIKFEPKEYLEKIKVPVLALNGTKDVQVTAPENPEGIREALRKAKNKHFIVEELEGLNHLFQTAKTGAIYEYGEIEETIAPRVLERVKTWVSSLK